MKKVRVLLMLLAIGITIGLNSFVTAKADEKESKVTVTIIQDSSIDSSTSETEQESQTSETYSKKKDTQQKLPQTDDRNNLYYSIIGLLIFLIALVGIIYNKKRNGEQYNEKN
ncbi:LPXTG cell wall anchor domain-containing protein [Enterococcus casseliflavus]|nr:LPXTG cell wall anchor domain-containing protein [Enterococcus casseliflavus]